MVASSFVFLGGSSSAYSPSTLIDDNNIPVVRANTQAPVLSLQVFYWDNHLRNPRPTLAQSQAQLGANGLIHESGQWETNNLQPEGSNYDGFGAVVGTRGEFLIQWTTSITDRGGSDWINAEFIPYVGYADNAPTPVDLTMALDINGRVGVFGINFENIGIYTVRIQTYYNGNPRLNYYEIWVRNGRVGHDFHPEMTMGSGTQNHIRFNRPLNFPSFYVTLPVSTSRFYGTMQFVSPLADNVRLMAQNTTTDVMQGNLSASFVSGFANRRLRINRGDTINLPHQRYTLMATIQLTFNDLNQYGELVTGIINEATVSGTIIFQYPPVRRPFPWWTLLISIVVLGGLGFAWFGSNWLINNSQYNHNARKWRRSMEKGEVDENNAEMLRSQIRGEREAGSIYEMKEEFEKEYEAEKAAEQRAKKEKSNNKKDS